MFGAISKLPANERPSAFVSASAIGYYGSDTQSRICDESSAPGDDFGARLVSEWEHAASQFSSLGLRHVALRLGVVLDRRDGAYARMTLPMRFYVASALGCGQQWLAWVHVDDAAAAFERAIQDATISG